MERLRAAGRELVVCTRAERGALALTADGRWIDVPAVPVERIADTNGAGDAFLAGTVFGTLAGLPIERSLAIGARLGAAAVQSPDLAPAAVDVEALVALTAT
jgi:sugar/nucleoside kinase (ribokinase family)